MNEAEANPNPDPNMEQKCPQCGAPLPSGVLAGLCPSCLFKQGATHETAVPPETAPFQPPGVEEVSKLFPQLEIIALLGKGGMGAVYKARQPGLDRIVALKILPPQTAGGLGFVERFNREARALAKLNHPNIVAVYEFGQVNGLPFFIMEFVDGLNLRQLEQAGKLSAREALQIVPQICDALQFAHDEGIVHRDIKPENILLDKKGRVKIADFGIAKILGRESDVAITETGGAIGTPHYMAPEQMEKPTTVDHRADIFSLGVVFYEMLTGELPLGKFAPPSSRKVEVDVRLDEVVLRALEKDPELRYQHASQVKTAVDTIAGSAAPPPSAAGAEAIAREILARDYTLNIRSCLRRGWALLRGNFWPFVGITALFLALLGFASSVGGASIRHGPLGENSAEITSALVMLVWGPLAGGLFLYFLKKIRNEQATVETAFCGFSHRFLHLFLAGFVTSLLTWLGFFCFILPGIYLLVAWMFTLPLVVDKGMDFWSAMELSRKMVTKHWWKFFGMAIVMLLLTFAGVLALFIGMFVMIPLVLVMSMYAYEDVFGGTTQTAQAAQTATPPPAGVGPSGTIVMPPTPPPPPHTGRKPWTLATKIGLGAVALVLGVVVLGSLFHSIYRHHKQMEWENRQAPVPAAVEAAASAPPASAEPAAQPAQPAGAVVNSSEPVFGPVMESDLTNLTTINLASNQVASLPPSVTGQNRGPDKDSAAYAWMKQSDLDLAYLGEYDGFYGVMQGMITLQPSSWNDYSPDQLTQSLSNPGPEIATRFGDASPLNNPTNYIYGFKTHDGRVGLLQIVCFTESPPAAKIRYKLVQATNAVTIGVNTAEPAAVRDVSEESLKERLDAASSMSDLTERDKPLTALVTDAAQAGNLVVVREALGQMTDQTARDEVTHEAAGILAKHGQRKQAIELAKGISDDSIRNQALAELAQ
jgi:predicted Ser/Thr protein kinase